MSTLLCKIHPDKTELNELLRKHSQTGDILAVTAKLVKIEIIQTISVYNRHVHVYLLWLWYSWYPSFTNTKKNMEKLHSSVNCDDFLDASNIILVCKEFGHLANMQTEVQREGQTDGAFKLKCQIKDVFKLTVQWSRHHTPVTSLSSCAF